MYTITQCFGTLSLILIFSQYFINKRADKITGWKSNTANLREKWHIKEWTKNWKYENNFTMLTANFLLWVNFLLLQIEIK